MTPTSTDRARLAMLQTPMTSGEFCAAAKLSGGHAILRAMLKHGWIHIHSWKWIGQQGRWFARYAAGSGLNAPKPTERPTMKGREVKPEAGLHVLPIVSLRKPVKPKQPATPPKPARLEIDPTRATPRSVIDYFRANPMASVRCFEGQVYRRNEL